MIKKFICLLLLELIVISCLSQVYATDFESMKSQMKSGVTADVGGNDNLSNALGTVVALIQYAGSGIALLVITLYGIKYMLASPADKADVKKQISPIIIGCILVFATANIVKLIASLAGVLD